MWSPNVAEWVYVQYATAMIGAIQVNINPAYRTSELEFAMRQSGSRMLVTRTSYLTSATATWSTPSARTCPISPTSCTSTPTTGAPDRRRATVNDADLAERAASHSTDDPINIQYTSGTTGFPKGATLSHRSILNDALLVGQACGYDESDRVCIPVPFYHCFGMVMGNLACSVYGATMVIPCASFDPGAVLQAVRRALHLALRRADDVRRRTRPMS